jgi:hypothetical protein
MSIQSASIDFFRPCIPSYFEDKLIKTLDGYEFGVLHTTLTRPDAIDKTLALSLFVDMSESMNSRIHVSKTMTQQELVNHTMKNIVSAIAKQEAIRLHIFGFDNEICEVQSEVVVTPENVKEIHNKIDALLVPRGSTNIENPIKRMQEITFSQMERNILPFNLLVTDGIENIGSGDPDFLKQFLVEKVPYAFMGVGVNCNTFLLSRLAKNTMHGLGEYRFVEDMEDVAVITGKLISEFLFNAMTCITITLSHAEIYDFESGTWNNKINVSKMTHNVMRTFHVRRPIGDTSNIVMVLTGDINSASRTHAEEITIVPGIAPYNVYETARHIVLQLLRRALNDKSYINIMRGEREDEESIYLKREMKELYTEIKIYIEECRFGSVGLFGILLNDLCIASESLSTEFSHANCFARLYSNGVESSYSPNNLMQVRERNTISQDIFQNHSLRSYDYDDWLGPTNCCASFAPATDDSLYHELTKQFSREHTSEEEMEFILSVTDGLTTLMTTSR